MNRSGSIRFSGYFGAGIFVGKPQNRTQNIAYNSYRYWFSSIPARAPEALASYPKRAEAIGLKKSAATKKISLPIRRLSKGGRA
jgi:hypothetical protein